MKQEDLQFATICGFVISVFHLFHLLSLSKSRKEKRKDVKTKLKASIQLMDRNRLKSDLRSAFINAPKFLAIFS